MKAIILCAGLGTRLGKLTEQKPKPMLNLGGKPLLEHTINYLRRNGFKEIGINLHFMPHMIESHFKAGSRLDVSIHYEYEKNLLGTAGALPQFANWLDGEDFLVIYGDILTNQDLKPLISNFYENQAFASLYLHKNPKSNSLIKLDTKKRIIDFLERPSKEEQDFFLEKNPLENLWVNSGIQFLSNKVIEYIKENKSFDLPKDVYMTTYFDLRIFGEEISELRVAIDSESRYELAKSHISNISSKSFCYLI